MSDLSVYAAVLLAAFGESTAFVGLLVPGVGIVLAAGALAARGTASLTGVALAASIGAVAGFGLSYHLGRVGGVRVARWSKRAHATLERSRAFFDRFGSWSIFWGHFFGPVRACVAFAAGAGGLPPRRFWLASASGSAAWGFALTAAGAVVSGGWRLVEESLGRGSLVLTAIIAALYVVLRLSAGALALGLRLLPPASGALLDFLGRCGDTPWLRRLAPADPRVLAWLRRRLSPDHATGLLLSTGAAACAGFAWFFFDVLEDLLFREPLASADQNLLHLLQTVRSPQADELFLLATYLGSPAVLAAAAAAGAGALLLLRRNFDAGLLLLGFGSGEALMGALKLATARPRPPPAVAVALESSAAFPSNHAFSSVALFGFLAYLGARRLRSPAAKARLFAWTGVLVVAVGFSRLYLGAHWPSDVAAGLALGGIWLSALVTAAEARARFGPPPPPASPLVSLALGLGALGAVVATWAAVSLRHLPADMARQLPRENVLIAAPEALPGEMARLAALPVESLGGERLGLVQLFVASDWDGLRPLWQAGDWVPTQPLRTADVLRRWSRAFRGRVETADPAYPLFWRGRAQSFALARPSGSGGRSVARCWATGLAAVPNSTVWAVWIRTESPPRRFAGIPLPGAQPTNGSPVAPFTAPLLESGRYEKYPVSGEPAFELLARRLF